MYLGATAFVYSFFKMTRINDLFLNNRLNDKLNTNFILLTYHETTKQSFQNHISFLDKNYDLKSYEYFLEAFKQEKYPSDLTFVITFDDITKNFYEQIFPVCEEIQVPIIIFVRTDPIRLKLPFWADEFREIRNLGGALDYDVIKSLNPTDRSRLLLKEGTKLGYKREKGNYITKEELREINKNKFITVGSHSVSHVNLAEEQDNILYELKFSKSFLEDLLKEKVKHFAYPYGAYNDYVVSLLPELGYESAVTADDRWVSLSDNIFKIPRVGAGPSNCSISGLETRIAGTTNFYNKLLSI